MNPITVIKRAEKFVAQFRWSTEAKDRVKAAGFKFDGARKEWFTEDAAVAASFNGTAPAPQNVSAPHHNDSGMIDVLIPAPDGCEYLPFQVEGIVACLTRFNDAIPRPNADWNLSSDSENAARGQEKSGQGQDTGSTGASNAALEEKRGRPGLAQNGQPRDYGSNASSGRTSAPSQRAETQTREAAWREWPAGNRASELILGGLELVGLGSGIRDSDTRSWDEAQVTGSLQSGLGQSASQDRAGNGWTEPSSNGAKAPRSKENRGVRSIRLDGSQDRPRSGGVLLGDAMGTGKTVQAIGIINSVPSIKRVLIICPASLKRNWWNELATWCVRPMTVSIISSGCAWSPCDIVIMNYEQVAKYRYAIDKVSWDLLIIDESHFLKSAKSQRTKAILGHWDHDPSLRITPIRATRKLFMTGTPVLNRPKELWTTVRALDRDGLGADWLKFHTRYCGAYQDMHGWQLDGANNLDELQNRLRSGIMIRRLKADVLKDLPAKRRQVILLPADTPAARRALQAEQEFMPTEKELDELRAEVERLSVNEADSAFKKAVAKLNEAENVAFSDTAKVRHQTALAKLPGVLDHLVNVLESEVKIVVFCHHHDVTDGLVEGLAEYGVVKIDGRDNPGDRQGAVAKFQNDPKTRVMVASIQAAGVGFTMTAASYVAFAELDWVPGNLAQAEDRLHRIGQAESVLCQYLMLESSFDGRMANSVVKKMTILEKAIG